MEILKIYTAYELELLINPAFKHVVNETISTDGFVENYNRLSQTKLNPPKNGLEVLIDQALGSYEKQSREYFNGLLECIHKTVYQPLQRTSEG